jgi:hypothetical protein
MQAAVVDEFSKSLAECLKVLKAAKKNRVSLSSHSYYSQRVPSKLAALRKSFHKLHLNYMPERYPAIAFQLIAIKPLVDKLVAIYPTSPGEMIRLLNEIKFKVESELIAEIEFEEEKTRTSPPPPFLPDDLIEDRHYVLKKVLWEVNRTYENSCYNSCASMIRRLTETIIIDAYEHHGLHSLIIDHKGDYLVFGDLIGRVLNQKEFKLTRETKRVLPDLKFFGDLGAHNRMAIVRKQDLDRLHNSIRIAIDELSRNI